MRSAFLREERVERDDDRCGRDGHGSLRRFELRLRRPPRRTTLLRESLGFARPPHRHHRASGAAYLRRVDGRRVTFATRGLRERGVLGV